MVFNHPSHNLEFLLFRFITQIVEHGDFLQCQESRLESKLLDYPCLGCFGFLKAAKILFFALQRSNTDNKKPRIPFPYHRSARILSFFAEPKREICTFVKNLDL
jgi:hypothetical protein